jgi:tetratricopeptide (TPR) repeat protein
MKIAIVGLLLVATAGAATATAAADPKSREEALAALGNATDVDGRRLGARVLGDTGTMADVPALTRALRDADPVVRAFAEQSLWEVWSRSGDPDVDQLLGIGVAQMTAGDGDSAVETFTRVIDRRPDFAEGWNKRATVYYLLGEYAKSLADCDEVIKRNPYHFGALSGYGLIYLKLDKPARALDYFERALAVNPNMEQVRQTVETLRRLLIQQRKNTL